MCLNQNWNRTVFAKQENLLYQVFHERFNSQAASNSGSAVFTSYCAIFRDQTHNKYGAYPFCAFLAAKIASPTSNTGCHTDLS